MSIRVRYIVALLLTATLVTLSFIVLYELISDQKKDAEIVNIAGQQRMLSQRIALLTSTPNICEDSEEQRYLAQSLARFKQHHQQLVSLDNLPASISNTYFNEGQLDNKVNRYIKSADQILDAAQCQPTTLLDIQALTSLLQQLDYVVARFEQDATAWFFRLKFTYG